MSLTILNSRLAALSESLKQTSVLIQQLSRYQPDDTPGYGSTPNAGASESDESSATSSREGLSGDIQDSIKQHEEELELLKQDVEDAVAPPASSESRRGAILSRRQSERERENTRLSAACARLGEDLKVARTRFRKAQLQAKQNADAAEQKERDLYRNGLKAAMATPTVSELEEQSVEEPGNPPKTSVSLFGNRRGPRRDPNATQADLLVTATSDVTASLRRTHALLTSEVSRSRFAHETLESSNKALEELNDRYASLDDLLSRSRSLLGTLLSSQKSDTWYLETAMYILIATIVWLVFHKLFYGPLWWLVWLPLKLSFRLIYFVTGGLVGIASSSKNSTASALTSQILSNSRPPLKVMPSASNGPPRFPPGMKRQGAYVPVGAGGGGAKVHTESRQEDGAASLSESIGTMVEQSMSMSSSTAPSSTEAPLAQQDETEAQEQARAEAQGQGQDQRQAPQQQQQQQNQQQEQEQARRGDGQQLRQRDPVRDPPNPKKRMMEGPTQSAARDEL